MEEQLNDHSSTWTKELLSYVKNYDLNVRELLAGHETISTQAMQRRITLTINRIATRKWKDQMKDKTSLRLYVNKIK